MTDITKIKPRRDDELVNVVIETPAGSRHKYEYDSASGLFEYTLDLPLGLEFPFGMGFVPNTLAEDDDPLDVLLMIDGAVPSGTIVAARPIGVLQAEQEEDGRTVRNDRVLAVARYSRSYGHIREIAGTQPGLVEDLTRFFDDYNEMIGRRFDVIGTGGPDEAMAQIERAIERA